MTFKYCVSFGVSRKIVSVPTKYVKTVKDIFRTAFAIADEHDFIIQMEDVDMFVGEWLDVTIGIECIDDIYLLPDSAKIKLF